MPLQKVIKRKKTTKENPIIEILGLGLRRVFLGISSLGVNITSFRLSLSILGLGDHILDCKGIFRGVGLHQRLSLLTHSSPFRDFSFGMGNLGGRELHRRRNRT